jgi:hypothetical protein
MTPDHDAVGIPRCRPWYLIQDTAGMALIGRRLP